MAKNYQSSNPDAAPGPADRFPSSETISREVARDQAISKAQHKPSYDRSEKERELLKTVKK